MTNKRLNPFAFPSRLRAFVFSSVPMFLLAVAALPSASSAAAKKRPPEAKAVETYAAPSAVEPGKTTRVRFFGGPFEHATGVWTSFTAEVSPVSNDKHSGAAATFDFKVPADVPVGIGAVRVATPSGVSDVLLFMVDDLPSVVESGENDSADHAQSIRGPIAIEGQTQELRSRFFRIAATKGQRIAFEVIAQRLGSQLDPVMRLMDRSGRELAWADDSPGAGSDCRFAHVFDADGDYLLELRDVNFGGGVDYRYRLRVGDFPICPAVFPIAGRRGTTNTFHLEGPDGNAIGPVTLPIAADAASAWLNAKSTGGQGSAFLPVFVSDSDEMIESEPNDSPQTATHLVLPATVSGRFDKPGDRDWYEFAGLKDQRLKFQARGRSIGLACDPTLAIFKPDGEHLTESRPASDKKKKGKDDEIVPYAPDDPTLEVKIPQDGIYRVRVEELGRRSGPGVVYRLEAQIVRPGFTLSIENDKVNATADGSFTIKVTCERQDYKGQIDLSLTGDAAAFALEQNVIEEGKTEAMVKARVPADTPATRPLGFTIVGKAMINGREIIEPASTLSILKKQFPRVPYLAGELDGQIGLGIKAEDRSPQ